MLNFNLKAKNIKRKLLNTHKTAEKQKDSQLAALALPDHAATAVCPSLKDLSLKETELNAREEALEQEKALFQQQKASWTMNMTAQRSKQTLIRQGATIMFRTHRLEAQQEKEEQERAMHALENGLLETTQQELDLIDQEHAKVIGNLLAATAAQVTCTAASLDANAKANTISDRLTEALDKVHYERLHVMELTEKMNVKSVELDVLMSYAKSERIKANETLEAARSHVSRFSLAAEAIELVRRQIEANVIEDRERFSKAMDKERGDALEEARTETQKRLAALKDARSAFEKLRETEKANLAKGYARVEQSRAVVDMEKELVKKEMVRARLLTIKAEQERAASVDAKRAALEELQAARFMRDESRRAVHSLHQPVAIADEMVTPKATSDKLIKNVTSPVAGGAKAELSGVMSRFGFNIGESRASSHGHINGEVTGTNETEAGKTGGLQQRCTSLNIKREDRSSSSFSSALFSRPRSQLDGSAHSQTEASSADLSPSKAQNLGPNPSSNADTKISMPIRNEHDISPVIDPSTEKCKQSSRMKLGSISNTVYQMR